MGHKGWRRVAIGSIVLFLLTISQTLGDWADWLAAGGGEGESAFWVWVGRGDSIASMLSFLLASYAISRTRRPGTAEADTERRKDNPPSTGMLNRDGDREKLRELLLDDKGGVVVVYGGWGVGKSLLVETVLKEVEHRIAKRRDGDELNVISYNVQPRGRVDIERLIQDLVRRNGIEQDASASRECVSSIDRLQMTLDMLGRKRAVIVIEHAENLLDPATHKLIDFDLDEVLGSIAGRTDHRVTVILISRRMPRSPSGRTWPESNPVSISMLSEKWFLKHAQDRQALRGIVSLAQFNKRELQELYRVLGGNLRLLELAQALLRPHGRFRPDELVRRVGVPEGDVPQFLVTQLVRTFDTAWRRAIEALDAYGTPVDASMVTAIVPHGLEEVRRALHGLKEAKVVRMTADGRYYLPADEADWMVAGAAEKESTVAERRSHLLDAADQLQQRWESSPRTIEDLGYHFAALRALLRARKNGWAYDVLVEIDKALRDWNCEHLLLGEREELRGRLEEKADEISNENALGDIYASRGEEEKASAAYQLALRHADEIGDDDKRVKINVNMGGMYLWRNDTGGACDCFKKARHEAEQRSDLVSLAGALDGLADCHRRWGRYGDALRFAAEARAIGVRPDYPDTTAARAVASRSFGLALKMARWHDELGQTAQAKRLIATAQLELKGRDNDWRWARYQDGVAAHHLFQDDDQAIERAMTCAHSAVDLALQYGDPVILMSARTTLCTAHLKLRQWDEAAREIERARWYSRRRSRDLLVLALQALVARRRPPLSKANDLFDRLHEEADRRIERDPQDFAAYDFKGFALCGRHLDDRTDLHEAILLFRTARDIPRLTSDSDRPLPTPGLVDQLILLLRKLDECGRRSGRLQPVIDALSHSPPSPADN